MNIDLTQKDITRILSKYLAAKFDIEDKGDVKIVFRGTADEDEYITKLSCDCEFVSSGGD